MKLTLGSLKGLFEEGKIELKHHIGELSPAGPVTTLPLCCPFPLVLPLHLLAHAFTLAGTSAWHANGIWSTRRL